MTKLHQPCLGAPNAAYTTEPLGSQVKPSSLHATWNIQDQATSELLTVERLPGGLRRDIWHSGHLGTSDL